MCLAAGAIVAAPTTVSAASSDCRPFTKLEGKGTTTDQATVDGTLRFTQYGPNGFYKTTLCAENGDPRLEVEMVAVRTPDKEDVWLPVTRRTPTRQVEALYPRTLDLYKGNWQSAVRLGRTYGLRPIDRDKVTKAPLVTNATAAAKRRARAATTGGPWKCSDNSFLYNGHRWNSGIGYHTNFAAFGIYGPSFVEETINGLHTWQFRYNSCGLAGSPGGRPETVSTAHLGTTTVTFTSQDGISVVDGGVVPNLPPCTPASLACAQPYLGSGSPLPLVEADIRLSTSYPWTIGSVANHFDIWSVVAHEAGHALGFGHDPWNDTKIMYPTTESGDTSHRWMGLGDYLAEHYIYG